jgi:hypothetical protein
MTVTSSGADLAHPIGADGIVSIRVRDGDVRIRAVDGDTLRARDKSGRDLGSLFAIELGEGSASLFDSHPSGASARPRHGHAPELDLDLPRHATIVVEVVSADIEADGLVGDQRYQTTSGDLTLRGISGHLDVEAVSGDLDIRATGAADVDARTVSGDIELRAGTIRSLRLATTSGDIKVAGRLAGPGPFAIETVSGDARLAPVGDVRVEMATLSGDLHSDVGGRTEGARGHRTLVMGATGQLVTFRSMSGDLSVVRPVAEPPLAPAPAVAPAPALPADPPRPPRNGAILAAYEDARLGILRSLERGEIDVTEAGRRFEALDGGGPLDGSRDTGDEHGVDTASDTTRVTVPDPADA